MTNSISQVQMMDYIKQTAKETAEQTGKLIRAEVKVDLYEMKDEMKAELSKIISKEITSEMSKRFGDMTPAEHTIQHAEMSDYLGVAKDVRQSWVKKIINGCIVLGFTASVGWALIITFAPTILSKSKTDSHPTSQSEITRDPKP